MVTFPLGPGDHYRYANELNADRRMMSSRERRAVRHYAGSLAGVDPDDDGTERVQIVAELVRGPLFPGIIIMPMIGLGFFAATAYYTFVAQMHVAWIGFTLASIWMTWGIASTLRDYFDARSMYANERERLYSLLVEEQILTRDELHSPDAETA